MSVQVEHLTKLRAAKDKACDARLFISEVQGAVNTGDISQGKIGLAAFHLNECVQLLNRVLGNGVDMPPAPTMDEMIGMAKRQSQIGKVGTR